MLATPSDTMRCHAMHSGNCYEYRHVVAFEETSLLGTVYFVNHLKWQGRCREIFLRQNAPDVVRQFQDGLCLVTTYCACEYFSELSALDEVTVRMWLDNLVQNRISLDFEYVKSGVGSEVLVARGTQQIACMRREGARLVPEPIPECLREALRPFSGGKL